ncbi:MAG: DNA polymerase III subunit delta [Candidatus Hydrogenedentes bacterium]|nr:DNA polymerase III subunit delta [Candidatus Hydrogenedentota bacterium]
MNAQELLDEIDTAPLGPLYLFCPGKAPRAKNPTFEPLLADRAVNAIIEKSVDPANKDLAFATYYADETPPGQIVLDAQTFPFLTDRRVILVRNAERYNTESGAGPLLDYLADPNESTILMLIANKIDRRTKFFKTCQKMGQVVDSPALQHGEVVHWAQQEVRARGLTIDRDAVRVLVDRSGTHLNDVENALTNVIDFVGEADKSITEDDVNTACADVAEEEVWALTDAIAASRPGDAIVAFRALSDLGKHPDELIGTINWLLKSAYAVAIAEGEPSISRFVAQKVRPLADKLGIVKIRAAFALCTDTQFMMRSTGVDAALALELLVIKLAAPQPRRRAA